MFYLQIRPPYFFYIITEPPLLKTPYCVVYKQFKLGCSFMRPRN
uniref:Uncharacterized protein n=1 Tax=Rhizophora mucronata TaxID=61149 RepID=A0A2P2QRU0_RHIMU